LVVLYQYRLDGGDHLGCCHSDLLSVSGCLRRRLHQCLVSCKAAINRESPYPGEWVGAHLRWGTKRPAGGLTSEGTTTWPWSGSQRVPALPGSTPWTRQPWRRAPGRWLLPSGRRSEERRVGKGCRSGVGA